MTATGAKLVNPSGCQRGDLVQGITWTTIGANLEFYWLVQVYGGKRGKGSRGRRSGVQGKVLWHRLSITDLKTPN
jgi:hypothetical protein